MKSFLRNFAFLLLVVILSLGTIKPLFAPGFFPMHDDTQPARIDQMTKSLSAGQFPVRVVGDLGYGFGYPLYNFYAPLPYYIGSIFNLAGIDAITSAKIMFGIGILLSAFTMFLLVAEVTNEMFGVVSSILYIYAPYHAVDIYVRGAVGEFYALAFLPLVILGIYKIICNSPGRSRQAPPSRWPNGLSWKELLEGVSERKHGIVIGSLGIAGVALSHNILGLVTGYFLALFLIVYLCYLLFKKQRLSVICYLLSVVILGFGLSAFFTLPALAEKGYTRVESLTVGGSDFRNHFVYLDQLWDSPWGFAGSAEGRNDGMSFKIGKLHLLLGLSSIVIIIYLHKRKKINTLQSFIFYLLSFIFLLSVFFMLEQSKFIWELLPGFPFVQYPWRFLSFTVFSLSFLSPIILILFKKPVTILLSALIIFMTIWINAKYFSPKEYLNLVPEDYVGSQTLRYKISKISDEYLPQEFIIPQNIKQITYSGISENQNINIISKNENPTVKKYDLDVLSSSNLLTNISFFPGWKAIIDNSEAEIRNNSGRIELELASGRHFLTLKFVDTPIRLLSNAISLFSLFLLVYVLLFWKGTFPWQKSKQLK